MPISKIFFYIGFTLTTYLSTLILSKKIVIYNFIMHKFLFVAIHFCFDKIYHCWAKPMSIIFIFIFIFFLSLFFLNTFFFLLTSFIWIILIFCINLFLGVWWSMATVVAFCIPKMLVFFDCFLVNQILVLWRRLYLAKLISVHARFLSQIL